MSVNYSLRALDSDLFTPEYFLRDDVCRLCWSRNANRNISPQHSVDGKTNKEFVDKICECLDMDLSQKSYPNKACENCYSQIEKFYEFKSFCKEADRRLQNILKNDRIKNEVLPCSYKFEKNNDFCTTKVELNGTESFDDFLDCLQSGSENVATEKKCKFKKKSKRKCSPTETEKKFKMKKKYECKRSATYCNICLIDYENEEKFTQHNSEAHGVEDNGKTFRCFGCEKRFKNKKTRLGHEINFCKGLKDGYKCSLCDRYLPKRRMYEVHMRDHRNNVEFKLPEDIFKCKKCYKLFKTKESMRKHSAVHHSEKKKFVCESCGRVFTRQDYLYKHKLTHTGVKQHVCPHCGFKSAQRSSLIVHIRKHTGERPYSCDECPQRCISSSNLRAHRRRHLGVKSYECNLCSKKFGYKVSLDEHVATTHERSQTYPCHHCGSVYARFRGLRRHLLAKHAKQDTAEKKNEDSEFYLKIVTNETNVEKALIKDESHMKGDKFFTKPDELYVFVGTPE